MLKSLLLLNIYGLQNYANMNDVVHCRLLIFRGQTVGVLPGSARAMVDRCLDGGSLESGMLLQYACNPCKVRMRRSRKLGLLRQLRVPLRRRALRDLKRWRRADARWGRRTCGEIEVCAANRRGEHDGHNQHAAAQRHQDVVSSAH